MKNDFLFRVLAAIVSVLALCGTAMPQEGTDIECVRSAIDQAERTGFLQTSCTILDHVFTVDYSDPILNATVRGPIVNTSRTFNIPRRPFPDNFKVAGPTAIQLDGKEEAIAWLLAIYEQITSGLSLSVNAPSTNAAINSTVRSFGAVVIPSVSPQSRAEEGQEETGGLEETGGAKGSQKERRGGKPGEVSADMEYETFAFVGEDGKTLSFRGAFERTTDAGGLGFGLRLAYSQVSFDDNDNKMRTGEATAFLKLPLAGFLEVGGLVTGTLGLISTQSDVNPDGVDQNVNSLGYGPFVSFRYGFEAGHMLAGGLMYQIIDPHEELDPGKENIRLLAYGAMAVFSISEKLALSAEGFWLNNLDLEVGDDSFSVLHPQLHFYISDSFGLILGYKTILGIEGYDSTEFTLGSSVRF